MPRPTLSLSTLLPLLIMALLAALTLWLERVTSLPEGHDDGRHRHDPDYIIHHMQLERFDADGQRRYTLLGERVTHYGDDQTTEIHNPSAVFFAEEGPTQVHARKGLISSDGKQVTLSDAVQLRRPATPFRSASTLDTVLLHIWPDDGRAQTDKPVHMTRGTGRVDAQGLDASNLSGEITLTGRVSGHFPRTTHP